MMHGGNEFICSPYAGVPNWQPVSFERSTASFDDPTESDFDSILSEHEGNSFKLLPVFDGFNQLQERDINIDIDTGYQSPYATPTPEALSYYPKRPLSPLKPFKKRIMANEKRPIILTRSLLLCPINVSSGRVGTRPEVGYGQGSYSFPTPAPAPFASRTSEDDAIVMSGNMEQGQPSLSNTQEESPSQSKSDTKAFPTPKAKVKEFVEFAGKSSYGKLYKGSKLYRNCFGYVPLYVPTNSEFKAVAVGEKIPFTSKEGDNPQCRWGSCSTYLPRTFLGFEEHMLLHISKMEYFNSNISVPCIWRGCNESITKKNLYAHIVSDHMANFYICRWCDDTYFDEDDMRNHASAHHLDRIQKLLAMESKSRWMR